MVQNVPESDWTRFRDLRELALERLCKQVLEQVELLVRNTSSSYHERYLDLWRLLNERDREVARAFDDPRRSRMIDQLAAIHAHGLLETGELATFTPSTRAAVEALAKAFAR